MAISIGRLALPLLLAAATLGGAGAARADTLSEVRARGELVCGVSEGLRGFSEKSADGTWDGFDVDFCKAVALAIFGDGTKVQYVPLSAEERFAALGDKKIDLLSRNSTWTMSRDVGMPLEFVGVSYFDGQGFMVPALYGATSSLELGGARICVVSGTTTQDNATAYFDHAGLKVTFLTFKERPEARAAYEQGKCDAYTADRSALAAERSLLAQPDDHVILKDVISKEPLGPVVRDDDPTWINLVRWTLFGLIDAEENKLASTTSSTDATAFLIEMGAPAAKAFGLTPNWLGTILAGVGNYGEIFARNLGEDTPMALPRGLNALWLEGGILYAPPME
ncbi:amino acid ABC transporter substrate-binding protein [Youhaiella tibetensis]|uniref:Amino acid ABC transporter substrate-binding protein n=1 Tax=Paradevosia tibetensis TaxID=1447062 RepID=A0A5B9DJ66_9HYPH|nr:amino acid ABC transporter substrate-binding protein [Youhaiella tibetensis]QEE19270.1 amino acid ABC transporter substrate-binding protein [Youhaiella tibetensis]GGF34677.1 amino acid ABC transporter substrate-binding protein [Youhaiella tibetensis]